jgi:glucuronate isomerase
MKFMDKDFLLSTKTAKRLFHEAAAGQPIYDYHCHLSPQEIADNRRWDNLSDVWLAGDHYKWRAMRANGIDERLITGDADPFDKFKAWAETAPRLLGNPLYHWTHLELRRYFGIDEPLSPDSAPAIWKAANDRLRHDADFAVFPILSKFNVFALGTTDDPADSLTHHERIASEGGTKTLVLPSFRPDRVFAIGKSDFTGYVAALGKAAGKNITCLPDFLEALAERVDFFDRHNCRVSDHDFTSLPFEAATAADAGDLWEKRTARLFDRVMNGGRLDGKEVETYRTFILCFLAGEYKKRGWAMQLHMGALRSINYSALKRLGPNTGFDVIHDHSLAGKLARLLDEMNNRGSLPKTILYSLNPKDYYPLATIMGSFQEGIPGKMQLGSAWWFLDSRDGMEQQMRLLASVGLLSRFVGMLTDSRSFLSYPRHEYFRRILCRIVGQWAEDGEVPNDWPLLSGMVNDIAFNNAAAYFDKGRGV